MRTGGSPWSLLPPHAEGMPIYYQSTPDSFGFTANPYWFRYPFHCHAGPPAWTWRRPFPSCGVASPQASAPDLESLPATIPQFIRVGPHPCRLDGALGTSNSSAPFHNRTEALDAASLSQSHEQAKVPQPVPGELFFRPPVTLVEKLLDGVFAEHKYGIPAGQFRAFGESRPS